MHPSFKTLFLIPYPSLATPQENIYIYYRNSYKKWKNIFPCLYKETRYVGKLFNKTPQIYTPTEKKTRSAVTAARAPAPLAHVEM